jgi:hypothetical protein
MSLKWSWAFGPETTAELNTLGQWNTSATNRSQTSALHVRSYLGSPGGRYSLNMIDGGSTYGVGLPTNETEGSPAGWLSGYVYTPSAAFFNNQQLLVVKGNLSGTDIRCEADSLTRQIKFYVNNGFIGQTVTTLNSSTWHHIAIRFDMSSNPWLGELWIDGVQEIVGSNAQSADTGFTGYIGSLYNSWIGFNDNTFWSDITFYDNWADPCPVDQFVTRIAADSDSSDNGTWSPASFPGAGGPQSTALVPPIAVGPVVSETTPSSGENVVIETNILSTKLGISPTNIYGVTSHSYAAGTGGFSIFTDLKAAGGPSSVSGPASVIGSDTYVTVTTPTAPGVGAWLPTMGVLLKTEVS